MATTMRYRINGPKVIHQTIEGEVVVINMESGCYYSLTGTAARIWSGIEAGLAADEIVNELRLKHPGAPADIEEIIRRFLGRLDGESLIVAAMAAAPAAARATNGEPSGGDFEPPSFEKFTDMQELLLLDPIHEVSNEGWPQAGARMEEPPRRAV